MQEYLTDEIIKEAIKINRQGRLLKRESYTLEFKQAFDWSNRASRAKYVKSIAAFANNKGGLLVFGISDSPRTILGLESIFIDLDDSELSQFISQYLSPTPYYERREIELNGNRVGALYVYPSLNKPLVCIKDYDNILSEGTIYFRYNSRNSKIKSGDLITLIRKAKEEETTKWMELFAKVSSAGIENVGIFNTTSGEIKTSAGNRFIIDDRLLKNLKLLDKYSIQEEGAEAVRIIGNIDEAGTVINRPFAIHDDDILNAFLNEETVQQPIEFVESICYQSSGIFPSRYFIQLSDLTIAQAIQKIEAVNTNTSSKNKLLKILRNEDDYLQNLKNNCSLETETATGEQRRHFYQQMIDGEELIIENEGQAKRVLEAVLNLEKDNYDGGVVKSALKVIVNRFYKTNHLRTQIRQAITYLDLIEYE